MSGKPADIKMQSTRNAKKVSSVYTESEVYSGISPELLGMSDRTKMRQIVDLFTLGASNRLLLLSDY